jgi:large subunit ribosomal protein L18
MSIKNESRLRRAKKTRMRIKSQNLPRLTVFKSSQHIYAQIIDSSGSKVLAATSTLDKSIKSKGRSVQSAKEVGEKIADLSIKNGIKKVIFDRSGYRYHGRIKMIAEAAREKGLEI